MKNKKVIILTLLTFFLLTIVLSIRVYFGAKEYYNNLYSQKEFRNDGIKYNKTDKRLIKVNGKLYYDTQEVSKVEGRCGVMDGIITSHVEEGKIPTLDDQANFSGNYKYQQGLYDQIDVKIDGQFIIFKPLNQTIDFLDENFKIELLKNDVKELSGVEYYQSVEGQKIYLVGLDEVFLQDSNNKVTLKDYITKEKITLDRAINFINSKMNYVKSFDDGGTSIYKVETLYDGGTKIYKYDESSKNKPAEPKISNYDFKMIRCHTLEGNRDIYIGLSNLDEDTGFKNGYCGK